MPSGSSANALAPDGVSDLGGGAYFHDTRVEVERSKGPGESFILQTKNRLP